MGKMKSILFSFDFLGIAPQMEILNNKIYKSIFSSLLSLITIIFSVTFGIYSFIEFINQKPMIDYHKNNDFVTKKTIKINESFIMFKINATNKNNGISNISFETHFISNNTDSIPLIVEPCEYGKNIDLKHKELLEKFFRREKEIIDQFFCINFNNKNISFFHSPNENDNFSKYIRLIVYSRQYRYDLNSFLLKIVTENDIIDHNNKENPIIPYYFSDTIFTYNISEVISLKYDYQYIKYESDTGIFLKNSKIIDAIGFSGLSHSNNINFQNLGFLAIVTFEINKSNYDYYKRTYTKFQSFLADVTSVINLIITILRLLTYFILNKKMSTDIIRKIMMVDINTEFKGKISLNQKDGLVKKLKDIDKDETISEFEENQNNKEVINESNNIKLKERNIKVLKNINLIHIIKSFFCFKDVRTKLIDLCNKIIKEDICIDRILSRFYNLEKVYCLMENKEYDSCKLNRKEEFKKINDYLFQINYEVKKSNNSKSEKKKKENTQIK